jgi:hypothetical protein
MEVYVYVVVNSWQALFDFNDLVLLIFPEFTDYSFGAQIVLTEHFYPDD